MNDDFPKTLIEFENMFDSEKACMNYLIKLRWQNGFICPRCGCSDAWNNNRGLFECAGCGVQTSVTAGTILHGTRKPLKLWFRAMWEITSQKYGANALGIQRILAIGSYRTAWQWLHRLRRAMVRPDRDMLKGTIEIDETYLGGKKSRKQNTDVGRKALVVAAVEDLGDGKIGRIRLQHIPDATSATLNRFIQAVIRNGSTIRTDDWDGYSSLPKTDYLRLIVASNKLKLVHRVIPLLNRWLLGTYQGGAQSTHLEYYLDEYTFRFNRRNSKSRGKLFYRLVQQVVSINPVHGNDLKLPAHEFIKSVKQPKVDTK